MKQNNFKDITFNVNEKNSMKNLLQQIEKAQIHACRTGNLNFTKGISNCRIPKVPRRQNSN